MGMAHRNSGQWFFGLIILLIGIIFLLENVLGIKIWEIVKLFWPVLLLLWGLMEIFQRKSIFFGLILLVIGVLFLSKNFDLYQWSEELWKFWPVIIIAIGIDQLFRKGEFTPVRGDKKGQRGRKEVITQDDEII